MIQIKMKCRKCGKQINFGTEGNASDITIIPHECDNCELNRKMDLLKKSVCGVCDKPISSHEFGFIGQIIIHQSCYPGGKSAYLADCRKENMPKI